MEIKLKENNENKNPNIEKVKLHNQVGKKQKVTVVDDVEILGSSELKHEVKKVKKEKKKNLIKDEDIKIEEDDINFINSKITDNEKSKKIEENDNYLGKKHEKLTNNKKPKNDEEKIIKSINKLTMEDSKKQKNEIKNYEEDNEEKEEDSSIYEENDMSSDEYVYESDHSSHSGDYEEKPYEELKTKVGKKKDTENENDDDNDNENVKVSLWDEKINKITKDDELVFDNSAYEMLHRSTVTWPCFSVDWLIPEYFIPQPIKNFYSPIKNYIYKDEFPYACYFVAGAQTSEKNGVLYYMKWFNMHKTLYDEDPDKEADSESEGGEPLMEHIEIKARGNVNTVRTMKNSYITAYWSDSKSIELVDLRFHIEEMENRWKDHEEKNQLKDSNTNKTNKKRKVETKDVHVKSFKKKDEGFALDWNNFNPGVFAAGGYENEIEIHIPVDELCSDYTGISDKSNICNYRTKFKAHKNGVESIVFSPSKANILTSGGNDKAIRIWDLRVNNESEKVGGVENAHLGDVNCVSWKVSTGIEMIASGSDDATVKLWDPRKMSSAKDYIANIEFHKDPITSLSWDPLNPCQLAVTSEDNRLSIWDFSVEPDEKKAKDVITNKEIPDQLVFLHQGQENLKDVKFHPYFESFLLSTAESGINVFKPNFNPDEDEENEEDSFTFNK